VAVNTEANYGMPAVLAVNITHYLGLSEAVELVADLIKTSNDEIFIKRVIVVAGLTTYAVRILNRALVLAV
jgi:hypothetical protein